MPRLKLKFDDLAYYLENRFKHNQMMAGLPSDMQKVLKRIEKMESEGRGLRYNLKGEYEIIVKNLSTSCYTVQLTNNGKLPLWAMVQETGRTPLMGRAFPKKTTQLSVSKPFVEEEGKMMIWTHVSEGYALGAHEVTLADYSPSLVSRKRARSAEHDNRSESVVDVIYLDTDSDDDVFTNQPWWEKQAEAGDREGATSNFKPGTKKHKSTTD